MPTSVVVNVPDSMRVFGEVGVTGSVEFGPETLRVMTAMADSLVAVAHAEAVTRVNIPVQNQSWWSRNDGKLIAAAIASVTVGILYTSWSRDHLEVHP